MSHANNEHNSMDSNNKKAKSNMFSIFIHADATDVWLMAFGFIGAVGSGLSFSFMFILSSKIMNIMGHDASSPDALFIHHINRNVVHFLHLACSSFVLSFLAGYCWTRTGERQASRIRILYLHSVLKQEIEYFDLNGTSTADVITSISSDNLVIQDVLSEKVPDFIKNCSVFVGSYAVGFILEWQLAIVALPTVLLLIIPGLMYGRIVMNIARKTRDEYNKANTIAEQAISSIRTIYSFVEEIKTMEAFSEALNKSLKLGVRLGLVKGIAIGSNGIGFAIWAFMAWYGSRLVMYHDSLGGNIHAAGVSIVIGGLAFGLGLSNLKYFAEATTAMEHIETVVRTVPKINSDSTAGIIIEDIKGEIIFQGVYFSYPSRPQSLILNDFNLKVPAEKTVALVGSSGSGKSTAVTLLERFYDPTCGEILIDGKNIKKFNLKWLRSQLGYVSQEPTLFATTIKENILVGKEEASMEEVVMATKASNAHRFICRLPQGYETQVGENGLQLSGGQKQRIAIARAILKSPKILLLDEATSALDSESEHTVQDALDIASVGRTTIIVAHRLSTICNADVIAVVKKGKVVESGSHDELTHNNDSIYSSLVRLKKTSAVSNENESSTFHPHACTELDYTESCNSTPANTEGKPNELEDQEYNSTTPSFKRLLALNNPEWMNMVFGCLSSMLFGVIQPLYAVTLGSVVSVYFLKKHEEIQSSIEKYSLIFVSLSIFSILLNIVQHYNFGVMGEQLTKRIRERLFSKMLSFEVSWFDQEENSTGAICSRLENNAYMVRSLVGDRIALVMQTLSGVTIAWTISLVIAWRLAIVMIVIQPIVIASYYARNMLLKGMSSKATKARSASSKIAVEAVSNIRMVAAFSSQCRIISMFQLAQNESRKESVQQSWFAGLVLGTSESLMCFTWALAFWYGTQLIHHGYIDSKSFFQTFIILITTAKAIADAGSTTTDIAKGASMVKSIFSILDRTTLIEPNEPNRLHPDNVKGKIDIIKVDFSYPTRPNVIIFKQLSLTIKPHKSVALVGPSGSGKSTIIGLIERFHDPLRGTIKIDDLDIKSYNLRSLRRHIALVGQEPTLFSGRIKDNIAYGSSNVTESELIDAARKANAHDFISSLKDGYDTWCGEKGKQLSGGQKQRIAIARAILKNPRILLLDEATSALDNHSEKAVQEALKYVMVGRTSVVIAHRLSTIENCDEIVVLENGVVVEKGTHDVLLGKGVSGSYNRLVSLQQSIRNGSN